MNPMSADDQFSVDEPAGRGGDLTPLQVALRWKWRILAFAIVMTLAAAVYVSQLQPLFHSEVALEIETRQVRVLNVESLLSAQSLDTESLRTEMEGLRSPAMAQAVVNQLNLTHDPEFCAPAKSTDWLGMLRRQFDHYVRGQPLSPSGQPAVPCEISNSDAVDKVLASASAFNDGRSYIIRIGADANSPALAANIANAYGEAFLARRNAEKSAISRQVSRWLTSYLETLRTQVEAANTTVAQYRDQHRLVQLQGGTVASQTLSELNGQLTIATAELSTKQSALAQLNLMLSGHRDPLASAPAQASTALQAALGREAELAGVEADLRSRFGAAHPQVVAASAQLAQVRERVRVELGRMVASLGSEVDTLKARQASLAAQVNSLQNRVGEQGKDDVQLQALQRDADTQQKLYETMLTRLKQIDAEDGMRRPDARVVVEARPSPVPSFPRKKMMIAGAFIVSLVLGTGVAFLFNMLSRVFRDPDQVEGELGLRVLGVFPKPPRGVAPHDMAVEQPFSAQTETLHSILAHFMGPSGAPRAPHGKVLLLTSALPAEGKSSFAVAIGRSAVRAGVSTILVDCDLRRATVNKLLQTGRDTKPPMALLAQGAGVGANVSDAATIDSRSNLKVLSFAGCVGPHELLSSRGVPEVMRYLRSTYDVVILDTPPLLVVSDALNVAPLADEIVMLVDFERTPRQAVLSAVRMLRRSRAAIAGVVLTKIDLRKYGREHGAYGYDAKLYNSYHAAPMGD